MDNNARYQYDGNGKVIVTSKSVMTILNALLMSFECNYGKKATAIILGPMEYLQLWHEFDSFPGIRLEKKSRRRPTRWMGIQILCKTEPGIELAVPPALAAQLATTLEKKRLQSKPGCDCHGIADCPARKQPV